MNTIAYLKRESTQLALISLMKDFFSGALIPLFNTEKNQWAVLVEESDFLSAQAVFMTLAIAISVENVSYRRQRIRELGSPKEIIKRAEEDIEKETERNLIMWSEIFEKSLLLECGYHQICDK